MTFAASRARAGRRAGPRSAARTRGVADAREAARDPAARGMEPTPAMHPVLVHLPGGAAERRELAGPLSAGGSHADGLLLPGCPPGALRLQPCAAGVVVEAVAAGVRAAGHPLHPGARRLLRPGERVELHGAAVEVAPGVREATRAAAAALLRDAAAGDPAPSGLHLVVLSGPAAGARHALEGDLTIGRGRRARLVLPDPAASRVHARVRVGPDGARIEDLGSKNGVRVNGVRIDRRPFPLRAGDEVVVGDTALALADGVPGSGPPSGPRGTPRRRPSPHALAAALLALSAAALALAAG